MKARIDAGVAVEVALLATNSTHQYIALAISSGLVVGYHFRKSLFHHDFHVAHPK